MLRSRQYRRCGTDLMREATRARRTPRGFRRQGWHRRWARVPATTHQRWRRRRWRWQIKSRAMVPLRWRLGLSNTTQRAHKLAAPTPARCKAPALVGTTRQHMPTTPTPTPATPQWSRHQRQTHLPSRVKPNKPVTRRLWRSRMHHRQAHRRPTSLKRECSPQCTAVDHAAPLEALRRRAR